MNWPPDLPTNTEVEAHKDIEPVVRTALANFKVAYFICGKLAADGYTSLQDLADRWRTK